MILLTTAALLVIFGVVALTFARISPPAEQVEAYLRAVSGGEPDRGWHYLSETARYLYGGDQEQYVEEASAADWTAFRWSHASIAHSDDGLAQVEVGLLSLPSSVPRFLIEKRLMSGWCPNGTATGLAAGVDARLFGDGSISGLGLVAGRWTATASSSARGPTKIAD
jgi:hypothetical protein